MEPITEVVSIKPSDLPAPPQAAIQIMRACSQQQVNSNEIAKLAANDPVLTAELLRVVNSPFFGLSKEVLSIPRAVTVLGQRALRNIALCISVRDALKQDSFTGFDVTEYWEDSLRRAVSARLLGEKLNMDIDDCFTAGLLQDFGLLVMFFLHPDQSAQWEELRQQDPGTRYSMEHDLFHTTHDKIILMLAEKWALPDDLTQSLGNHHHIKDIKKEAKILQLGTTLYCADWMSAIYTSNNKNEVISYTRELLTKHFGLETNQIEGCLSAVPKQVEEAAMALGLKVNEQKDLEEVLHQANVRLAEENLSYQELTWRLEKTLKERDELSAELNREIGLAKEIQQGLLPKSDIPDMPIYGINIPARDLSGDFYDFFKLDEKRIYFNLGDVSGKGINAALLMAKTSSLFRCLAKQIDDPGKLLQIINNEIRESSVRGMFVSMIAGIYNTNDDNVTLVNAGHMPALLLKKDGTVEKIDAQAPPLGIDIDNKFPSVDLNLSGGSLYLYTDGVTEGKVSETEELGIRGLLKLALELRNHPASKRLDTIASYFNKTGKPLRDDITLLLVERTHAN